MKLNSFGEQWKNRDFLQNYITNDVINISIPNVTHRAINSLVIVVNELCRKGIELLRVAKTSSLLLLSGLSSNSLSKKIIKQCVSEQNDDGGWVGVVDTMWCACLLDYYEEYRDRTAKSLRWLKKQQKDDCGWGKSRRDMSRIPVTGALLYFLPQLADRRSLEWLEEAWERECNSITYKASYTLMGFNKNFYQPSNRDLIKNTTRWLANEQNEDGGWGPWKIHPVGSNILCTSLALLGLLQYPQFVDRLVFENGLKWLIENQLPNGLWKYHQIEDGSSWGLYAFTEVSKYLLKQ